MPFLTTELPLVHLNPGEHVITTSQVQVNTILGSCVSVTYFHPRSGTAAIFHALLPNAAEASPSLLKSNWTFVDTSVKSINGLLAARGIRPGEVEVKVFGGADTFGDTRKSGSSLAVAARNIEMAFALLDRSGYRIMAQDVGGARGRKIIFLTSTGEVLLKRLKGDPNG
jgi:chemotaxis protein CheD